MIDLLEQNYNDLIVLLKYNKASIKELEYATNLRDKIKKKEIDEAIINTIINGIHPLIIKIILPELLKQIKSQKKLLMGVNLNTKKGGALSYGIAMSAMIGGMWWLKNNYCAFFSDRDICKKANDNGVINDEDFKEDFTKVCSDPENYIGNLPWIQQNSINALCMISGGETENSTQLPETEIIQHNVTVFNNLTNNYDLNVSNITEQSDDSIRNVLSNITDTNKTELMPHIYNFSHLLKKLIVLPTKIETPKLITMVKNVTKITKLNPIPEIDNTLYDLVNFEILDPIEFDDYFNKVLDYDEEIPERQLITWFKELTIKEPSKISPYNPNNPETLSPRVDLLPVIIVGLIEQVTTPTFKFLQPKQLEYNNPYNSPYEPPRITYPPKETNEPTDEFSRQMICLFLISLFGLSGIFIIIKMITGIKSIFSSKKLNLDYYTNQSKRQLSNNSLYNLINLDNLSNNLKSKKRRRNNANNMERSKKKRINTNVSPSLSLTKLRKTRQVRKKTKQVQNFYKQIIKFVNIIERQLNQKISKANSTPTILTITEFIKDKLDDNDDIDADFIDSVIQMLDGLSDSNVDNPMIQQLRNNIEQLKLEKQYDQEIGQLSIEELKLKIEEMDYNNEDAKEKLSELQNALELKKSELRKNENQQKMYKLNLAEAQNDAEQAKRERNNMKAKYNKIIQQQVVDELKTRMNNTKRKQKNVIKKWRNSVSKKKNIRNRLGENVSKKALIRGLAKRVNNTSNLINEYGNGIIEMDDYYTNLQKEQKRKYNAKQGARNAASKYVTKLRKKLSNKKINSLKRKYNTKQGARNAASKYATKLRKRLSNKKINSLQREFAKNSDIKDKKIETLTNQYAEITENNEYLNSQITNLDKQITDLDQLLTDQESELFYKDLSIQDKQKEILSLQNKLDSQQEVIDSNTKSLEKTLIKITKLNNEKDMLENRIETIRKKNEELRAQKENSKRSSNQKNTELEKVNEIIKKNNRQIKTLKEELEKATASATEFYKISEDELRSLREKNSTLTFNKKELEQKIDKLKETIQEKDAEIDSIENNNVPLTSSYLPLSNEQKRKKRAELKAKYMAQYGYTNTKSLNQNKINRIVNKKMKEYELLPNVTSTDIGTNPVMTLEATTQTSLIDTNRSHVNRRLERFKQLFLEFDKLKSEELQPKIDNLNKLIQEYQMSPSQEKKEEVRNYVFTVIIPFQRTKLNRKIFFLKLHTKQIKAALDQLKRNFYGFSKEVNTKFTTLFLELLTNFDSLLESFNQLATKLYIVINL